MSRPALGPNQPPREWVPGSIQGCTVAKAWHSPLSSSSYEIMYEYSYNSTSLYPSRCGQEICTLLLPLCPMADGRQKYVNTKKSVTAYRKLGVMTNIRTTKYW